MAYFSLVNSSVVVTTGFETNSKERGHINEYRLNIYIKLLHLSAILF